MFLPFFKTSRQFVIHRLQQKNGYGVNICKQSLDERFNEKSVEFVKTVLPGIIEAQLSEMLYGEDFFSSYQHVRIKDSTKFNVPSTPEEHYRDSGGNSTTSSAGISIRCEFDLKTGKIPDLILNKAVRNNRKDAGETAGRVCKNDLVIRDLGYFSTSVFQVFRQKEAFFLSRLQSAAAVYDEKEVVTDFGRLYAFMSENRIEKCERQVFIGRDKLPVCLPTGLVPAEVYEQQIRRKQKEEKKKGRQMKEHTKLPYRFNLFITGMESKKTCLWKKPYRSIVSVRFRCKCKNFY